MRARACHQRRNGTASASARDDTRLRRVVGSPSVIPPFDPTALTPGPGGDPYHLAIEGFPPGHFRVESLTGKEALSEPYAFQVVATVETTADEEAERIALGRRAMLVFHVGPRQRAFYGVISAIRLHEVHDAGTRRVQYHLRLVPRLWLLKRRKRSRIFQRMRVPEIIAAVLGSAGIGVRFQLLREHPPREYCTQYEESDLRFVQRLCAEAGMFFTFPTGGPLDSVPATDATIPGDTVVFGDDASTYPSIGEDPGATPTLYFLSMEETKIAHDDKITRFSARTVVKATTASYIDYDPERPGARLSSTAASNHPFPSADAPSPDGAATFSAGSSAGEIQNDFEVYEHHGPFLFPQWSWAADEASLILRQKRRRASTASGESGCSDLSPGHRFKLADHPAAHLDRVWAVTRVEHRGHRNADAHQKIYWSRFDSVPSEVTFIPPRPKRSSVQVSLTATVVGPPGEEIHVDSMGQIKVQFHWDRDGGYTDHSSCWIRTMHPWGGAGWGHQFIPRVGMEVVVVFEGGDPDKPFVLGALYNGTHPPPFVLPADKTRSGIKTQSTPGGSGSNELSFEDQAGREQVYLHAQRDLDEVVERNHTSLVRGDERLRLLGSRVDIVEEDLIARVGHNVEEHVSGDRTTEVEGNRIDVVTGNSDERVSGARVTRIEGRERRDVKQNVDLVMADDLTTRVHGCMTTLVGKHDAQRSWVTHAEGLAKLTSLVTTEVGSEGEIVLRVGKSSIRITSEKIEIEAPAVTMKGAGGGLSAADEGLKLSSKKDAELLVEKKLLIKSADGASMSMGKEVKVDGEKILLNSPEKATDPPPKAPEPPTKIELTDEADGKPIPYQRFLIVEDSGAEVSGTTDKDGKAELELKESGKITFPDVTMPGDKSDKGDMRPHVVRQGDYLTRLGWMHGFDADEVWDDPKNAELKGLRKDHNILAPGDVVYVPAKKKEGLPVEKGGENKYAAKVPRVSVGFLLREDETPVSGEPYFVQGLGEPLHGTTSPEGQITVAVPVHVAEVSIILPKRCRSYRLLVGHMDPVSEPSGAEARLAHLGLLGYSAVEGASALKAGEEDLRAGVKQFQAKNDLPPTGVVDDATRNALMKTHLG
jgi:type VI secretion system secreted protein VgrG